MLQGKCQEMAKLADEEVFKRDQTEKLYKESQKQ